MDLETVLTGELLAHTILLYDGAGRKLPGGFSTVYPGSGAFTGNRVDVNVAAGAARATTDEGGVDAPIVFNSGARDPITFLCNASCNPTRVFTVVVVSASDNMSRTGFILDVADGTLLASRSGNDAHVLTGRMFEGSVLHAASEVGGVGVGLAQASHTTTIDDRLVGVYLRGGPGAGTLSADTPSGRVACGCAWTGGVPGGYAFRLDDTDVDPDEAYLAYADVAFP